MRKSPRQIRPGPGIGRGRKPLCLGRVFWAALAGFILPVPAWAIQLHQGREGILVHQAGHLFFLLSMVALVFIITGRQLNREKGWRMIQCSAILFVIWNLDTVLAHFFDNQIRVVTVEKLSLWQVKISAASGSQLLVQLYHSLKLDHLLCVPAMFLFYRGLSSLLAQERSKEKDAPKKIKAGDQ